MTTRAGEGKGFREREGEMTGMERPAVATLERGTTCTAWNYSGERLAAGSTTGTLSIFDSPDLTGSSSSFSCTSKTKVHGEGSGVARVAWVPPEYGNAVACVFNDGSLSIWEETSDEEHSLQWKLCKSFAGKAGKPLDLQFGFFQRSLKMVVAYSDGSVKVYELSDPLELINWQLQAEFQNVIDNVSTLGRASCFSASISWSPRRGDSYELSFVLGFNSDAPQLNSAKVWEFDQAHHRWLPVAELALPAEKSDQVFAVAWAPNIGRPYEVIAVATRKGIAIWHIGLNPDMDGRLPMDRVALLSGFEGEVWQMEWDVSGLTLATTGTDDRVRLWQSNLNGVWHEQAAFEPVS